MRKIIIKIIITIIGYIFGHRIIYFTRETKKKTTTTTSRENGKKSNALYSLTKYNIIPK